MTWEQKIEMIKLHNKGKQREMQDFVEPLLTDLDGQAEDMLFNALELTQDNIKQNPVFFIKLSEQIEINSNKLDFFTGVRREYFKLITAQLNIKTLNP